MHRAEVIVDHVTTIVSDADIASKALTELLGATPVEVALPGMAIRTFRVGNVELHVNAPTGPGPVADHLRARGPGYHHLALRVDDLDAFIASCAQRGFRALGAPVETAPGLREVFLDPAGTGGVLIQLVERRSEAEASRADDAARSLDGEAVRALVHQGEQGVSR